MEGGKLWDQDQPKLVGKLRAALKLGEAYQKQYRAAWEGPGSHAVRSIHTSLPTSLVSSTSRCLPNVVSMVSAFLPHHRRLMTEE